MLVPNVLAGQNGDTAGIRLFEAGKFREAKTIFEPAFRSNARDAAAAFYLGRIAMEEKKNDRAADYFESATKLDPKNSTYFLWLGRAHGREAQNANVLRQPGWPRRRRRRGSRRSHSIRRISMPGAT